jgi:sugar lactone lactonase YvrE
VPYGYRIYFTERAKHRVVRWDPDSGVVTTVAGGELAAAGSDQALMDPYGLAIDKGGHLLIADKLSNRIVRITNRVERVEHHIHDRHRAVRADTPSHRRRNLEVLQCPTGLFVEPNGDVLCAYSDDHTIYRLHRDGRSDLILGVPPNRPQIFGAFREVVPAAELADAGIWGPTSVVARPDGTIFFIERGYQEVRMYRPGGELRAIFPLRLAIPYRDRPVAPDRASISEYHPTFPTSLTLDGAGRLYMTDIAQGVVMSIDLESRRVSKVIDIPATSGPQGGPVAMTFGPDGTAWLLESRTGSVRSYRPTSTGLWSALPTVLQSRPGNGLTINHGGAGIVCGS